MEENRIKESVIDFILKYNEISVEDKSLDYKILIVEFIYSTKYQHKKVLPNLLYLIRYDDQLEQMHYSDRKYIHTLEEYVKELEKGSKYYKKHLGEYGNRFKHLSIGWVISSILWLLIIILSLIFKC